MAMSVRLKREIQARCSELHIPLVGFAPVDRYDIPRFSPWVPEEFRPGAIIPRTKTVIVIGIPVSLPALETSPSIWYYEEYRTANALLDAGAHHIASFLNTRGFASTAIPRDGYGHISILKDLPIAFFSHRHAAFLAGLGNFGINNVILTKQFGPRVRFASVFTTAEVPPDPVMEESLCIECMECVKVCPVHALPGRDYPKELTDKRACAMRAENLATRFVSPCGFCIRVCPIGEDRTLFGREKSGIYDPEDPESIPFRKAWAHVRKYGVRKKKSDEKD
jgi:epoxyqueuosine reductase QueG